MDTPQQPQAQSSKGYGKRPLWQWILVYLVVGGIVYYGVYYFAIAKKGGYNTNNGNQNTSGNSLY